MRKRGRRALGWGLEEQNFCGRFGCKRAQVEGPRRWTRSACEMTKKNRTMRNIDGGKFHLRKMRCWLSPAYTPFSRPACGARKVARKQMGRQNSIAARIGSMPSSRNDRVAHDFSRPATN